MQNNYQFKPRGIVKWHAFAALISGEEQKHQATDIEKINVELLDDRLTSLDSIITEAITFNHLLGIKYLENNEFKYLEAKIIKIDNLNKSIIFESITLKVNQIIDLIII